MFDYALRDAMGLGLFKVFEHPAIEGELDDGGEEALAAGVDAETGDAINGERDKDGSHH